MNLLTSGYNVTRGNDCRVGRDESPTDRGPVLRGLPGPAGEEGWVQAEPFVDDSIKVREARESLEVGSVDIFQLLIDLLSMLGVLSQLAENSNQGSSRRLAVCLSISKHPRDWGNQLAFQQQLRANYRHKAMANDP